VEWRLLKRGATVCRQPRLTLCGMFVQLFYFVSYYFLEMNMMISFLIFRRHIIAGWGRDMRTIFRPIWISNQICGWRQVRLVDPIKIRYTDSPTLQPRTCRQLVVSQPFRAPNQYQASSMRSSWPWNNNINNSQWIMDIKSQMGGTCAPSFWPYDPGNDQPPPPPASSLFQFNFFFWKHFKIVMNIWILY